MQRPFDLNIGLAVWAGEAPAIAIGSSLVNDAVVLREL
jgi:hypothetical protein